MFWHIQSSLAFYDLLHKVFSWLFLLNLGCVRITYCHFPLFIHFMWLLQICPRKRLRKWHGMEMDKDTCKEWEKRPWRVLIIVLGERALGACALYSSFKFIKEAFSITHWSFCFMVSLKRRKLPCDQGGFRNHEPLEWAVVSCSGNNSEGMKRRWLQIHRCITLHWLSQHCCIQFALEYQLPGLWHH